MSRKVGRPPNLIPTVHWKLCVPVDLAAKIDLLNLDPVRGCIKVGSRSALVTELLRAYVENLSIRAEVDVGLARLNANDDNTGA